MEQMYIYYVVKYTNGNSIVEFVYGPSTYEECQDLASSKNNKDILPKGKSYQVAKRIFDVELT